MNKNNFLNKIIKNNKPALFLLVGSFLLGSFFLNYVGSLTAPDIDLHYGSSMAVATGQVFNVSKDSSVGKVGSIYLDKSSTIVVPENYLKQIDCQSGNLISNLISNSTTRPIHKDSNINCLVEKSIGNNSKDEVKLSYRQQYPLVNYLPQGIGLKIGMLLNLKPHQSLKLARVIVFIFYIVSFLLAIYIMPKKARWLLAFAGLMPVSIFLATSFSSDTMSICVVAIFVSYVLRLYDDAKKLSIKQLVLLFLLGISLFLIKIAYSPVWLLMLILLKNERIKNILLIFFSVLFIGLIIYLVWAKAYGSILYSDYSIYLNNKNIILSNPLKYILLIIINLGVVVETLTLQPSLLVTLSIFTLYSVFLWMIYKIKIREFTLKNLSFSKWKEWLIVILPIISILGCVFATLCALLLSWTIIDGVGFRNLVINGFQGRYLLPLLPLLCSFYFVKINKFEKIKFKSRK